MKAAERQRRWQGAKWCHPTTRLAIYLRDGLACSYCFTPHHVLFSQGIRFSLDHIKPSSKGGSHKANNLVTCCEKCNKTRCDKPLKAFLSPEARAIIRRRLRRALPREEALVLLKKHGTPAAALAANARLVQVSILPNKP